MVLTKYFYEDFIDIYHKYNNKTNDDLLCFVFDRVEAEYYEDFLYELKHFVTNDADPNDLDKVTTYKYMLLWYDQYQKEIKDYVTDYCKRNKLDKEDYLENEVYKYNDLGASDKYENSYKESDAYKINVVWLTIREVLYELFDYLHESGYDF